MKRGDRFRFGLGAALAAVAVAAVAAPADAVQPAARPAFTLPPPTLDGAVRRWFPARPSLCAVRRGPLSYSWPVRPFRVEHPIRAFYGDPRTIFRSADDARAGAFSFHNGVDISAPDLTPVYPVVSGTVVRATRDEIVVSSSSTDRIFQYWHLIRAVHVEERVRAYTTELGVVQPGRGHVHLTEIDDGAAVNPLEPGHLMPYRKTTAPTVTGVYIRNPLGRALDPHALAGTVTFAATAYDTPPLPLPPPWTGVPLTPAVVRWQLTDTRGRSPLPLQTAADFNSAIPDSEPFDAVYDTGTYQNFPTVGAHYFFGAHGQYVFKLTASALNTRALAPGAYTLTVSALDTCGNLGTLTERIEIVRQPGVRPLAAASLTRLGPTEAWPRRFWTIVLERLPVAPRAQLERTLAGRALAAGAGPGALLNERGRHRVLGIAGAFPNWVAAYTTAERIARVLPGVYALDVALPVPARVPRARRPEPGTLIPE